MNDAIPGAPPAPVRTPAALLQAVLALRARVVDGAAGAYGAWRPHIVREEFLRCADNLACYLALRRHDLSRLQQELACWGVSSLGRSEAHVIPNIDAVAATLASIAGVAPPGCVRRPTAEAYAYGSRALQAQKQALFGDDPGGPTARIMVTLPAEAATDPQLCAKLVAAGVDCARINCAHDHVQVWRGMAASMRAAAASVGRTCRILADLGGGKVRIDRVSGASPLRVKQGDRFALAISDGEDGTLPTVWCNDRTLLQNLRVGASLWVDDGKIGCVVEQAGAERALLRVTAAREKGNLLKPGKGLSCLDSAAAASALTAQDRVDLDFVVQHADMVGYSFVQTPEDVRLLQRELDARGRAHMPIVLKIETRAAVQNLPRLIVAAAGRQPAAVMVARGDLALALGFERLAEVQEEMLWLCESASVPVIWATQVLERLIKKGRPARGEATDAAMSQRAECVMLNKGPHLVEGVRFLEDVLTRMDRHQAKKSPRLTELHAWGGDQRLDASTTGA